MQFARNVTVAKEGQVLMNHNSNRCFLSSYHVSIHPLKFLALCLVIASLWYILYIFEFNLIPVVTLVNRGGSYVIRNVSEQENKSILGNACRNYTIRGNRCGMICNFSRPRSPHHIQYSYSIGILTMNIDNVYPEINRNITFNRMYYASFHHYVYIEINNVSQNIFNTSSLKMMDKSEVVKWSKPFVIKRILSDFKSIDFILWLDFDALVLNCEITIESILNIPDWFYWRDNKHRMISNVNYVNLIVSGDFRSVANNGVFLMHNTQWSQSFLDRWIGLAVCDKIRWEDIKPLWSDNVGFIAVLNGATCFNSDHAAIQDIMKTGRFSQLSHNDVNQSFETWHSFLSPEMKRNVAILPQKATNMYQRQSWYNLPVFIHFAGMKNRSAMMTQWLEMSTCA